ncbi:MAG: hypothetical protein LBQ39_10850 [Tannerellaceae bacterium]|jgi:beta-mannosidase|nr:hypothetical protein [Tannerellaceae bacterium]
MFVKLWSLFEEKKTVALPANTSHVAFGEKIEKLLDGRSRNEVVVHVAFTPHGKSEAIANTCFLSRYKDIEFPKAVITTTSERANDGFDVTVKSDAFARGVFLSIEGIDHFFSDNYFDLLPGEPVTIHVTTPLDKAVFDKQLKAISISDAY